MDSFKPVKGAIVYHHERDTKTLLKWIHTNKVDKKYIISIYPENGRTFVVYTA